MLTESAENVLRELVLRHHQSARGKDEDRRLFLFDLIETLRLEFPSASKRIWPDEDA